MHDPNTVAFDIRYPWPWPRRVVDNFDLGREHLITIWHVDPERSGAWGTRDDDSCDWFGSNRNLDARETAIMEAVWNLQTEIENKPIFGTPLYPSIEDPGPVGRPWVHLNEALRAWRHRPAWRLHPRWHVWHGRIQVIPIRSLKRWLFSRCDKCGKSFAWGEAPISGQWNGPGPRWFRGESNVHHAECDRL